jgi:hypothetical protein
VPSPNTTAPPPPPLLSEVGASGVEGGDDLDLSAVLVSFLASQVTDKISAVQDPYFGLSFV